MDSGSKRITNRPWPGTQGGDAESASGAVQSGNDVFAGAWCQTGCQTGQTLVYEGGSAGVAGSAEKSGQDAEKRADHQYGSLDLIFGMDILVLCRA